jgi:hypothetical protein
VADRRPFGSGCSLSALDAAGYRYCRVLVPLRLGYAIASSASLPQMVSGATIVRLGNSHFRYACQTGYDGSSEPTGEPNEEALQSQ